MDAVLAELPAFARAFGATLSLLLISGFGALVLGVIIAAMRISPVASLRAFATVYTEIFRNVPLTLVLFFCATLIPYINASFSDYYVLALLGLTVYTSPFVAEAVRSGINGVAVGQAEAARAIGLGFGQVLTLVVLPQAVRMVIPPLINVFIALTKNTSVAGAFFIFELFANARGQANQYGGDVIAILVATAVLYLVITITLGRIAEAVERKVAVLR
ncbi:amino acid ABC transporter permease [Desertivibrio insolitus]|uniref:amino acid ABC transporter permease n=1 Tax=Herbiconiux sp. SYSU D00978 TaxID=2812562 RepID=UPI001A96E3EF|nr:amino acid ABC transporter permease [Herbiconiux sp. SYSU D00978]